MPRKTSKRVTYTFRYCCIVDWKLSQRLTVLNGRKAIK